MYITYLLGFIFLTYFYKYMNLASGKKWVFDYWSGKNQGILIDVLCINPVYDEVRHEPIFGYLYSLFSTAQSL